MKILLVGSKGMLATDLIYYLSDHELVAVDIDMLDICNLNQVLDFTAQCKPDLIINCAAYTNVDGCETDTLTAYRVNAIGPRNLAIASNQLDAPLLHISTDYVFDGEKGSAYLESDVTNPLSVYGKSKLDGENLVKSLTNQYFIIRTQWLFGKNGKNFVKTILAAAKEKGDLKVVNDQFGCPTYTKDLCAAIATLILTKNYGTYQLTNSGIVSWYDFTKEILNQTNLSEKVLLTPCKTSEFPRPAKRPAYSPMSNFFWEMNGFSLLRDYKEALREYLKETGEIE